MKILPTGSNVPVSRRDFMNISLRTAALPTVLSILPGEIFANQSNGEVNFGANYKVVPVGNRQKPIVIIWLEGGISHFDTFSPVPTAPDAIKGPYSTIQTSLPGVRISEKLPLTARHMHKVALMRNIKHKNSEHMGATSLMFSGSPETTDSRRSSKIDSFTVRLGKYLGESNLGYVTFNADTNNSLFYPGVGQDESLYVRARSSDNLTALGASNDPYPSPIGERTDAARLRGRNSLLGHLDSGLQTAPVRRWDTLRQRANSILDGDLNSAFDLSRVPDAERNKYGKTLFGNAGLITKRMINAGAPIVLINKFGWDHHSRIEEELNSKLPELDKVLSSLLEDIGDRAIIAVGTEFGRTPMNTSAGRDHWPQSNFLFIGGAGIDGKVYGQLDNKGLITGADGIFPGELMGPTIAKAAGYEFVEERAGVLTTNKLPYLPIFGE